MLCMMVRMILVNTSKSYPSLARRIITPAPGESKAVAVEESTLELLAEITCGDWRNLSDGLLAEYGDYLLGTCSGVVTVAYRITGHERFEGKLRFEVEPATELTPLIGQPQPEGPWKRGEARGTRQVRTPESLPPADLYNYGAWVRGVLDAAQNVAWDTIKEPSPLAAQILHQWAQAQEAVPENVQVSTQPDGTVVIDVPPGQDVLVRATTQTS